MTKSNAVKKFDVIYGELKILWSPNDSIVDHFNHFVSYSKNNLSNVFSTVRWEDNVWEISAFESTQSARRASHKSNVVFTQRNGLAAKRKVAVENQKPFEKPYLDFVKSLIVLRHMSRPTTHDSHMVLMRALRYLYEVFVSCHLTAVHQLNRLHFDQAISMAMNHGEMDSTLYRTGDHLAYTANQLNFFELCSPFEWNNPIPRDCKNGGGAQVPLTKKALAERASKLPESEYLVHLAALWRHYDELLQGDKMTVCMGVMLLCTGLRMDEFCGLHVGCMPTREQYEAGKLELTYEGRMAKMLRLNVLARKRFVWDSKIISSSLVDTAFLLHERLTVLSEEARHYAKSLLKEQRWPALDRYDDNDVVLAKELAAGFGFTKTSNFITQLERCGVSRHYSSVPKRTYFSIRDIHRGISAAYRKELGSIEDGLGPAEHKLPVWELLTLQFKFADSRGGMKMFPLPLSGSQVQDAFRGRDYVSKVSLKDSRIQSMFERYSFDGLELKPGGMHSHQFRHLLNTIMQQSAMFSQQDIAKYFLRSGVRDNEAYDHSSGTELVQSGMDKLHLFSDKFKPKFESKQHEVDATTASELIRKFPLLSASELMSELDTLGSSHVMSIGRCRHDYSQSPCGKHYACLNNCKHYRRTKGDVSEVSKIRDMKESAERQIKAAQLDVDDQLTNAHVWLAYHQRFLAGCDAALAIEDDDRFQEGQVITIFPAGRDSCEAI